MVCQYVGNKSLHGEELKRYKLKEGQILQVPFKL